MTSLVAFLSGPMGLIFCGQLGKTALATVGLANSVFNVAGLAVITGLLTAVDTLFSQVNLVFVINCYVYLLSRRLQEYNHIRILQ